ncbi:hypothetical protein C8J57DRAFT_1226547 [Mycena rebaudengoi]|nr:hypothetical protein C8J57DRAFT_1226547 [Mycena rebaudengoi]
MIKLQCQTCPVKLQSQGKEYQCWLVSKSSSIFSPKTGHGKNEGRRPRFASSSTDWFRRRPPHHPDWTAYRIHRLDAVSIRNGPRAWGGAWVAVAAAVGVAGTVELLRGTRAGWWCCWWR